MTAPQCWAFNKQRQRCEQHPGHEDEHRISVAWTDDECFDPEIDTLVTFVDKPIPFTPTGTGVITMNAGAPMSADFGAGEDDDMPGVPGLCFSCGCPEVIHPCDAHQCRSYVP